MTTRNITDDISGRFFCAMKNGGSLTRRRHFYLLETFPGD
jgi:hypothetical protein